MNTASGLLLLLSSWHCWLPHDKNDFRNPSVQMLRRADPVQALTVCTQGSCVLPRVPLLSDGTSEKQSQLDDGTLEMMAPPRKGAQSRRNRVLESKVSIQEEAPPYDCGRRRSSWRA